MTKINYSNKFACNHGAQENTLEDMESNTIKEASIILAIS